MNSNIKIISKYTPKPSSSKSKQSKTITNNTDSSFKNKTQIETTTEMFSPKTIDYSTLMKKYGETYNEGNEDRKEGSNDNSPNNLKSIKPFKNLNKISSEKRLVRDNILNQNSSVKDNNLNTYSGSGLNYDYNIPNTVTSANNNTSNTRDEFSDYRSKISKSKNTTPKNYTSLNNNINNTNNSNINNSYANQYSPKSQHNNSHISYKEKISITQNSNNRSNYLESNNNHMNTMNPNTQATITNVLLHENEGLREELFNAKKTIELEREKVNSILYIIII